VDVAGMEARPRGEEFLAANLTQREKTGFMADTSKLSKEERKTAKRTARKKRKSAKPQAKRDYPRGSKKSKVKKMVRGQAKR
jgi:hypothetical protein